MVSVAIAAGVSKAKLCRCSPNTTVLFGDVMEQLPVRTLEAGFANGDAHLPRAVPKDIDPPRLMFDWNIRRRRIEDDFKIAEAVHLGRRPQH